jgi:hypothetical protein
LRNAGVSWKTYQGDISGTCIPLTDMNEYAPRHDPFVYFDDVTDTNNVNGAYGIAHIRPYTELAADLASNTVARYNFITPSLCDDMHDSCDPIYDPIRQGDNWLASEVPRILSSRAYSNCGALFIAWDESYDDADTRVGMIVLSPLARGGGYTNSIYYTHSSTLRTMQEIFNVMPLLGDAGNATDLSDLFRPTNHAPAELSFSGIVNLGSGMCSLTVSGVDTDVPVVLLVSSDLKSWVPVSTNVSSQSTFTLVVTNGVWGPQNGVFYRVREGGG